MWKASDKSAYNRNSEEFLQSVRIIVYSGNAQWLQMCGVAEQISHLAQVHKILAIRIGTVPSPPLTMSNFEVYLFIKDKLQCCWFSRLERPRAVRSTLTAKLRLQGSFPQIEGNSLQLPPY